MIKDAQDYGALNVHMRAQRTELFTAGTYNLLASSTDFTNLRQMLADTRYNDIIGSEMVKKFPNLVEIDRRLTQHFVDQYNKYRKFIPKRSKSFIDVLSTKYFLNNFKTLLVALHGENRYEDTLDMMISLSEPENDEIDYLFKSSNIENLIERIRDEKLREVLEEALGEYRFLNLVYPLISAIDQFFYTNLCNAMMKLKRADKIKTKRLFGIQIGIQNIEIILRAKTFDLSPGLVKKWLISTKFCSLKESFRNKLINTQKMEKAIELIRDETPFRDLGVRLISNIENEKPPLDNFDRFANQIIIHNVNSIFRGTSFNITIYPAFFILKEMEIRNLRSIILGKIHKRPTNEILDRIVLL